ncbi:MAG: methyltransferase, partial [Cucumibacter sp.]
MSLDQPSPDVKPLSVTRDGFLDGRLTVEQPVDGFRAGLDSVLLGASVRVGQGRLLDLGCGAGVAGLVALTHNPRLSATFSDTDRTMLELCARNIGANGFSARAATLDADATADAAARARSGFLAGHFDAVIANPPFYDPATATVSANAPLAHAQTPDNFDRWVATAASVIRPGGEAIFVHRAASLALLLEAFACRFGGIDILPLAPHSGAPAFRIFIRGTVGIRAPLTLMPPIAVHASKGGPFSPDIDAILRGRTPFLWHAPPSVP